MSDSRRCSVNLIPLARSIIDQVRRRLPKDLVLTELCHTVTGDDHHIRIQINLLEEKYFTEAVFTDKNIKILAFKHLNKGPHSYLKRYPNTNAWNAPTRVMTILYHDPEFLTRAVDALINYCRPE